jgi:hypothetical protein
MLYSRYKLDKDGKRVRKDQKEIEEQEMPKGENSSKNRKPRAEQKSEKKSEEAPKKKASKKSPKKEE